jgi:hypothetical protein
MEQPLPQSVFRRQAQDHWHLWSGKSRISATESVFSPFILSCCIKVEVGSCLALLVVIAALRSFDSASQVERSQVQAWLAHSWWARKRRDS